ncbi:MAG: DEAD/DEAH box helicase [Siculibacillus sp.]|nr:DEAD/DEAH box helicase [Siculibacillus sp.]
MTKFTDFGLAEPILAALATAGYETPTPIQTQAIPQVMSGRDLLGIAQTGTGKTAAFALPIIQRLTSERRRPGPHGCRSLVLAPTRELASQIAESFRSYGANLVLSVEVVFGGVSIGKQERALQRGIDVLVATPGRLLDLVDRGTCRLDAVEILVLDEADQMLDLGFIHSLKRIAKLVPKKRQSLFFSATMPAAIAALAANYLTDPVEVAVAPVATTVDRVEQGVFFCETREKQALLEHLLRQPSFDRVIVFTRTKHGADRVVKHLARAGFDAAAIHGNKSQPQRERALAAFRDGEIGVLIATDIAARGIDIDGISHVVNFDLPNIPESYVHRIGRTARAGADGSAVSLCNAEERAYLKNIERLTRRQVPKLPLPQGLAAMAAAQAKEARREIDDEVVAPRSHHHAGRPSDERRGGEGRRGPAETRPQGKGPRGPRGPREEFRARDENRPRPENRRTEDGRRREEPHRRDDVPASAMRDTRHGETVAGRGGPAAPRDHVRRDGDQRPRNGAGGKPMTRGGGPGGNRGDARPQGNRSRGPRRDA